MDSLRLMTAWDRSDILKGAAHLTLSKIQLQGATLDGSRLKPLTAESPTNNCMADVMIAWVPREKQDLSHLSITVPLYSNPERSSVIAYLQLPIASKDMQPQYILAGLGACLLA